MFNNIGKKIKTLAVIIFIIESFLFFSLGMVFVADGGDEEIIIGLVIVVVGSVVAWVSSWFLYGFGEIIDKLKDIERNTRGEKIITNTAEKSLPRKDQLDRLRSQGLISEEEFQQAVSEES